MKRLLQKLEDMVVAVTFAEAGEYKFALEVLGEDMGPPPLSDPEQEQSAQTAAKQT